MLLTSSVMFSYRSSSWTLLVSELAGRAWVDAADIDGPAATVDATDIEGPTAAATTVDAADVDGCGVGELPLRDAANARLNVFLTPYDPGFPYFPRSCLDLHTPRHSYSTSTGSPDFQ